MSRTPKKAMYGFALSAVVGALAIAGCGGGGSSGSSSGSSGSAATIDTASIEGLGPILVDSEGMTVYEFTVDKGTTSECYGGCEAAWPPVVANGKPTAGEGAMSSALGTTKRKDGTLQVTYEGHPLYTFAEDSAPGEVTGNEVEGTWFVLDRKGAQVTGEAEEGSGGGAAHSY